VGRVGARWRKAGHPSDHLAPYLSRLFRDDLTFKVEHLPQPWPVTIARQHITRLHPPLFNTPVATVHRLRHRAPLSRYGRMGNHGRNILSELGLIVFDNHHIVPPGVHDLLRDRALRQQGVHRHDSSCQDEMAEQL
jgi:hypothetical protein